MKKKKMMAMVLSLALMVAALAGCGSPGGTNSQEPVAEKAADTDPGAAKEGTSGCRRGFFGRAGYHKGFHISPAAFHPYALYIQNGLGCGKWL